MLRFICLFAIVPVFSFAAFAPLKVTCSVTSRDIPGIADVKKGTEKTLTLSGPNTSADGHQMVTKMGPYEMWIVTSEVLQDEKKELTEILTYNAEIRNTKTGDVAQARSDDSLPSYRTYEPVKRAAVALARYGKDSINSLLEVANLRMYCYHQPSHEKSERLTLRP